jgi:FkbM family methyltransferase
VAGALQLTAVLRRPVVHGRALTLEGDVTDAYFTALPDGAPFSDEVTALLARMVGEDWVIVDVGANIGLVTLALSNLAPAGTVHAFEPMPRTAAYLRANVEANRAANVRVNAVALGAATSELRFFDNVEFSAGSLALDEAAPLVRQALGDRPAEAFVRVPCTTLDDFAREQAIERLDLVKIDAEGFDVDVLRGARKTIARFRPCVLMEFAGFALATHRNMLPADALTEVRAAFDRVFVLDPGGWLREIADDAGALELLRENAHGRPVQDLLCACEGSPGLRAALAADREDRARLEELERLRAENVRLQGSASELTGEVERLRAEVRLLRGSASWRMTAPLRLSRRLLRGG